MSAFCPVAIEERKILGFLLVLFCQGTESWTWTEARTFSLRRSAAILQRVSKYAWIPAAD